jgi:hypothetical protein
MPTPNQNTFDLTPPRRPAIADLGGGQKVNGINKPDPVRMPTAEDWNQFGFQIEAANRVLPVLRIVVTYDGGGNPIVSAVQSQRSGVLTSDVLPTKNGTGDISLDYTLANFPAPAAPPCAHINGSTPGFCAAVITGTGVRVHTNNAAGALQLAFSVDIY